MLRRSSELCLETAAAAESESEDESEEEEEEFTSDTTAAEVPADEGRCDEEGAPLWDERERLRSRVRSRSSTGAAADGTVPRGARLSLLEFG